MTLISKVNIKHKFTQLKILLLLLSYFAIICFNFLLFIFLFNNFTFSGHFTNSTSCYVNCNKLLLALCLNSFWWIQKFNFDSSLANETFRYSFRNRAKHVCDCFIVFNFSFGISCVRCKKKVLRG